METFLIILAVIAITLALRLVFRIPPCLACGARRGDLAHFLRVHPGDEEDRPW